MRKCPKHGCPSIHPMPPVFLCITDDQNAKVWVGDKVYTGGQGGVDEAYADAHRYNPGLRLDEFDVTPYSIERNGRYIRQGRVIHYHLVPPWLIDGAVLQRFFAADDLIFTIGDRQYDNRSL